MKPTASKTKASHPLLAIALCLSAAAPLAHAEEGASKSNGVREFLSNRERVGSLTGTIIGGALTAHPVGTVAGSIIGFFIGKETMHKPPEQQQLINPSYARRSFVPDTPETAAAPTLALSTATEATPLVTAAMAPAALTPLVTAAIQAPAAVVQQAKAAPALALVRPTAAAVKALPPAATIALASPTAEAVKKLEPAPEPVMALAPPPPLKQSSPLERIASYCYGNGAQNRDLSPDLEALCYYHQSS
jgi:hypothetical protein